jgi:hypothetical protein
MALICRGGIASAAVNGLWPLLHQEFVKYPPRGCGKLALLDCLEIRSVPTCPTSEWFKLINHQVMRSVDVKSFLFFALVTLFGVAHAQDAELARKKCVEFGFKEKTPSHGTCMDQFLQATGAVKAPAQPSAATPPVSSTQLEEKFWDATMAVGNKEAFEAYLENYPRGRYAGLAKANITRMDGAAATQQRALAEASEKLATERAALEAEQKLVLERAAPQPVMAASVAATPASATSASASAPPVSTEDDIAWMWPTDGPVLAGFDEVKMKGLDIGGTALVPRFWLRQMVGLSMLAPVCVATAT